MSRSDKEERSGRKLKYASARKRAEKKQRESSFSATYLKLPPGLKLFKAKEGIMYIDILPFRAGEGNPCAEEGLLHYERTYHMHARVGGDGGSGYLCPRLTSKSPCPICEYRQNLLKKSDPDDEKMIKDLAPKERQLFNVINLKEPDKGIQLWDFSYHLFGKLLDARIRNSDEEDGWDQFASLTGGMTLKVAFKEKSFGGRTFVEAETIDFKARQEDYDDDKLEETHCLDTLLIEPEYDALKETFLEAAPGPSAKKKAKPTDDEEEEEDEDEEPAPRRKSKAPVDEDDEEEEEDEPKVGKKSYNKARTDTEDDDEDEEDEEPAPKKKKPPVDEDDDEEEDEPAAKKKAPKKDWSDFDEDEEDEPVAKKKAKPADDEEEEEDDEEPAPKKKAKPPVDDDDEEEEEEEEPAPAPRKRKSRAKVRPEPEEDEDEEDEEPARVKSRKPADDDDEEE
jgi:gp32 DNA binding protein like